ncbi:DUF551 domain-containing protein [Enterobacter hormaechei subsp. steigerwaltii]
MITITTEQAQKIIEAADEIITALAGTNEDVHPESDNMLRLWDDLNDRYAPPEVVRELARIALASLEAEPAIHRWRRVTVEPYGPYPWHYGNFIGFSKPFEGIEDEYYYTAPPAPVADEDLLHMAASAIEDLLDHCDPNTDYYSGVWADVPAKLRRAAMLQGAEPVTTANKLPFEQWLSQQTGTIDVECGCVMTEVFFHWLRVAYEAGNSPALPDSWVACSERLPEEGDDMIVFTDDIVMSGVSYSKKKGFYLQALGYDDDEPVDNVTHWMPLPAAPQQEV